MEFVERLAAVIRNTSMNQDELPTTIEELREYALNARRQLQTVQQQALELTATIASQKQRLEKSERTILELLQALRGKQRERIDPDQLLLFELGELEKLIEENATEQDERSQPRRKKRRRGRRMLPDNLPREEIVYELPEEDRLCPIDGQPMPVIRFETSEQLDFEPAKLKVIVHRRAVYACPAKHDEAKLLTAAKPRQAIEKGLATSGLLAAMVVGKFGRHSAVCWSYRSVAESERKLVHVGYAGSAIIFPVIAWKIFCRAAVWRFVAAPSTTGWRPSPTWSVRSTA